MLKDPYPVSDKPSMSIRNHPALGWYFKLYDFIAENRLKKKDIDPRAIHTILVSVLSTGILMWAYAYIAYLMISNPIPGYVGTACAIVHLLSLLIFRFSNRITLVTNCYLLAGITHQSTYAYYTGGFSSYILIWFGILPMLAGVCNGRKGVLTWFTITVIVSSAFFYLDYNDYHFPNDITEKGRLLSQFLLVFGWILISSSTVMVYTILRENTEKLLNQQGHKIDDLFRVLFHDLANPLGRIAMGLTIAKRQLPEGENRGFTIAQEATDSMLEITQNIRRMYAVSRGKANMDLVPTSIQETFDYINKVFATDLSRKHIKLKSKVDEMKNGFVITEPVSFKNQVLGNIISNAIKFSPVEGTITIKASAYDENKVLIEVSDEGEGIPPEILKNMFDLSKKTTRPGTKGETGTGFGMHIMKSFVEMYGGEVQIETTTKEQDEKTGTTIRLILKGEWS